MDRPGGRPFALGLVTVLVVLGMAGPVAASPAPVSGCPPCGEGFIRAAAGHGLATEVRYGGGTVQVHGNGSATWTVRVVPTNESVVDRLAENRSLARAVAADSFGVRYGDGIDHELVDAYVEDGAFVIRYRTLDVVDRGPFGTLRLTYFRDSPGAYVYTDLGADELTVIAPPGTTVARGFGDVAGDRMTATELPDVRDGPFVVFAPDGSATPSLLGTLAVLDAIRGVLARNVALFVALPGAVVIGGFAGIRRALGPDTGLTPGRLGGLVAAAGAVLLAGAFVTEGDALPSVTGNLLLGGLGGAVLLALGAGVARPGIRRYLTGPRLIGVAVAVAVGASAVSGLVGAFGLHRSLTAFAGLLPAAVALGWIDAGDTGRYRVLARRLLIGLAVAVVGLLAVSAPLRGLGGPFFVVTALLSTAVAVAVVVVAIPLYLLGSAGGSSEN